MSKKTGSTSYYDYAPGSRPQVEDWFCKVRDSGQAETRYGFKLVLQHEGKEATSYWDTSVAPVMSSTGTVEGVLILTQDVSERKQTEEALRQSEEKYRLAMEATSDGLWDWIIPTGVVQYSQAYFSMLGYGQNEFLDDYNTWLDLIHPDDRKQALAINMDCIENRCESFQVEFRMKHKDGEWRWILGRGKAIERDENGKALRLLGTHIDITERKRAEEALRESEEKYRLLVNQIPAVVFQGYGDWGVDFFDNKIEILSGYTKEEFDSRQIKWCELILPEDLDSARVEFIKALKNDKSYLREYRIRKKDGSICWIQARGQIFCDAAGKVDYVSGVFFDITEHKRAEEAFQTLVSHAPMGIFIIQDGKFMVANPGFEAITGYRNEELFGQESECLAIPLNKEVVRREAIKRLKGESSTPFEFQFMTKSGEIRWGLETIAPTQFKGKRAVLGYFMDITEHKQLEEQLLQAQKMEAVGTLAGGIAHDFNNILTAILGNIGLAALDDKIGPWVQDRLVQAEAACLRAQALSQQLLTFAKGGAPVKKLFSVAELLTESTAFACVGSPVRCETTLPENLWWIEADPGQIGQVFQNLTINAIQAMPTGGTITVGAENLTLGTDSGLPLSAGRYIKISLRDQGMGIPAEHLPRIFDPYFTTKHKGSGLGLASAYAIINKHHGHIAVESKPGGGTTFNIYLPAVEQQVTPQPGEDRELLVGTGKILEMDDKEMVRKVLGRMLARLGYEAEFARDGGEAIEMFVQAQGFGQAFAAVIQIGRAHV